MFVCLPQDSNPYGEYGEVGRKDKSFWEEGADVYGGDDQKCGID